MTDRATTAPLTLAEFEREANHLVWSKAHESFGAGGVAFVDLRPLVLRLMAGERERCAREAAALGDSTTAHAIRNMGGPT